MIKNIKIASATLLCAVLLLSTTSCFVAVSDGHHRGKSKNSNNPHHPRTTNPGHTKGKK